MYGNISICQFFSKLLCAVDDKVRYTCQLGYLNSIAFIGTAADDFAEKDDIISVFLDGNTVITDPWKLSFKLSQLMVMSGKQCFRTEQLRIADIFHDSPGNAKSIKSARAASDLVQNQQTVFRCTAQNICNLGHLDHERALSACKIIRSANPGENTIHQTDFCTVCRYKASDLCHQYNQRGLSHIG